MMRNACRALILALLVPSAASAAEEGGKSPALGTQVDMPFLIAPMTLDGRLDKYAYINAKLVATSQAAAIQIREKLAFIQDAFVRDVNGASIAKASDPAAIDEPALAARLVADAKRVLGPNKVATIIFTKIKFSSLHPAPGDSEVPPPEAAPPAKKAAAPKEKAEHH